MQGEIRPPSRSQALLICPRDKQGMKTFNIARERMLEYQESQSATQNRQDLLRSLDFLTKYKIKHWQHC